MKNLSHVALMVLYSGNNMTQNTLGREEKASNGMKITSASLAACYSRESKGSRCCREIFGFGYNNKAKTRLAHSIMLSV
jgi:hypothetical protein